MNKFTQTAIILVVAFGLGFLVSRLTTPERTVEVRVQANTDSLRNVWLQGKIDTASYGELEALYRQVLALRPRRDTVRVGEPPPAVRSVEPGPDWTSWANVQRAGFGLDTALALRVLAVADGDTTQLQDSVGITLEGEYYFPPVNLFHIGTLAISVPDYAVPVSSRDPSFDIGGFGFGLKVLGGVHAGTPGGGLGLNAGPIDAGALYHTDATWTFLAGWRLPIP